MEHLVSRKKAWLRKWSWHKREPIIPLGQRLYSESFFSKKLIEERRRAERSRKPLLVMVLNAEDLRKYDNTGQLTESVGKNLQACLRETDICGLLNRDGVIGVILTEVESDKVVVAQRTVAKKTREKLEKFLNGDLLKNITISFKIFPDEGGGDESFDMTFYPELTEFSSRKLGEDIVKRAIDIIGSITSLIIFSPLFAVLPILIKTSSQGPVFFRQERFGINGKRFRLIKFRSMFVDNDDVIHKEYVKRLINGESITNGIYKIQGDPRVTKVGKFLRKYSLDELPQFLNVLKGDMSLVGPRPPIRYEVDTYSVWQRNRLMGKKPGITGLWQVTGRSSTTFDEMVRLDLRYLSRWTIILDLKILFRTPVAVLKCKGAY